MKNLKKSFFIIILFFVFQNIYAQLTSIKLQKNIYQLILPKRLEKNKLYFKIEEVKTIKKIILFKSEEENFSNIPENSILSIDTILNWIDFPTKAKVNSTFENAFNSGENILNPQYQYYLQLSPDKKKYLIYHYYFNLPVLKSNLIVLDTNLNILNKYTIDLESEIINYGFYLIDSKNIISINTLNNKGIYVNTLNLNTLKNDYLTIEEGNLSRREVKVYQLDKDIFYLCNLCENRAGELVGIMYSKLNLKNNKIDKIFYHEFKSETIIKLSQNPSIGYFYINNFEVDKGGNAKIIMQRKNIISPTYNLNPYQIEYERLWKTRKQKKVESDILIVEFFKEGKLVREDFIK